MKNISRRMPRTARARAPRPRARRLPPAERRARLLTCALRVFARRGLGAARHAEIAREARVSLSTVFVYFPTRAALVRAVLDEVDRFYTEMAEQVHGRDLPPAQRVLEHTRGFAASVDTHPDHARVWLDWSTAMRADVWPRYLEFQERMVGIIARTIGTLSDADAEETARLMVSCAHMVAQMKFTHRASDAVERFLRTLVRAVVGVGGARS
jgi:TetR/AcrR family hemagglutinin/protease transcriptional regulator